MRRPGRRSYYSSLPVRRQWIKKGRPPRRRGRPRFKNRRDPAYLRWIRRQRCTITGLRHGQVWTDDRGRRRVARIQACHVVSRGAGGYDRGNTVPMQAWLHRKQHRIGIKTFQAEYAIDLTAKAFVLELIFEAIHPLERAVA